MRLSKKLERACNPWDVTEAKMRMWVAEAEVLERRARSYEEDQKTIKDLQDKLNNMVDKPVEKPVVLNDAELASAVLATIKAYTNQK